MGGCGRRKRESPRVRGTYSAANDLPEKPLAQRRPVFPQHLVQQHGNGLRWRPSGIRLLDRVPPELHAHAPDDDAADLVLDARDVDVECADHEMRVPRPRMHERGQQVRGVVVFPDTPSVRTTCIQSDVGSYRRSSEQYDRAESILGIACVEWRRTLDSLATALRIGAAAGPRSVVAVNTISIVQSGLLVVGRRASDVVRKKLHVTQPMCGGVLGGVSFGVSKDSSSTPQRQTQGRGSE